MARRRGGTKANVDVSDLENFEARLRAAAADIGRAMRPVEKAAAAKFADLARAKAPRGVVASRNSQRYGPLHQQIGVRMTGTPEGQKPMVHIGTAFYGLFLEYGTVKMRRRPFIRPAIRKVRPEFRDAAIAEAMRLLTR